MFTKTGEEKIILLPDNDPDNESEYTADEIARGFIKSRFNDNIFFLLRNVSIYIAAKDGLNSTASNTDCMIVVQHLHLNYSRQINFCREPV